MPCDADKREGDIYVSNIPPKMEMFNEMEMFHKSESFHEFDLKLEPKSFQNDYCFYPHFLLPF